MIISKTSFSTHISRGRLIIRLYTHRDNHYNLGMANQVYVYNTSLKDIGIIITDIISPDKQIQSYFIYIYLFQF